MASKTYLCLGAGPGIGLCTAIRFAREGCRAILVSRNPERQKLLAREFESQIGELPEMKIADVGDAEQMRYLANELSSVDIVHYNAAVIHAQTLEEAAYDDLSNDIRIGVSGALFALKAFYPQMLERKSGTFLMTGGMLANNPLPQYLTLGVAKAAIRNMTQALFEDFRKNHIHIATVTVSASVGPQSQEANEIADLFWKIFRQPESGWSWEEEYKSIR